MSGIESPTLAGALWPRQTASRIARIAALMIGGTIALTLAAKIQVPFYPVPMTLQTLAVLVIGATYGARLAGATLALYLFEGLVGLPVFAGVLAGPAYIAGKTGGYLISYVVAAALIGFLAERGWDRAPARLIGALLIGEAIIFGCGFAWLAQFIGAPAAWTFGVAPFLLGDALKVLLAAALITTAWRWIARLRRP
jgi:biotin transport system substrate-specific component